MKTIFITAIYANLHGTDLGGRVSRHYWYRWSLISILKVNPTKVICFTSEEELKDLEQWFFEVQNVDRNQLEFKVFNLRESKFYSKIQRIKDVEYVKTWDRCVEIQYNKFFWYDLIDNVYDYDRIYWVDAGLSHGGLFPEEFRMGDKWEKDFLINLFTPELLDKWNNDTADKILVLAKNNKGRYFWANTIPEKYYHNYDRSQHIIGGVFGGTPKNYKRFARNFERQLWQLLINEDELFMEEHIMTCMYFNEPENYNAYTFDDWYKRDEWEGDDVDPKLFYHMFLNE